MAIAEGERIEALRKEGTQDAADQLLALAESADDKETRKAARKALYLLSQSGVAPSPKIALPVAAASAAITEGVRAYSSHVDGSGARMVAFALPSREGGRPTLLHILVRDDVGLRDAFANKMSSKELNEYIDKRYADIAGGIAFAEIEPDYARWLVAKAYRKTQAMRRRSPAGFLEFYPLIGAPAQDYPQSPVYDHITAEEIRADNSISRDPETLFSYGWFEPWFFEVEPLYPWLMKMAEARRSVLEVSEEVKRERQDRVRSEALEEIMPPTERADYVRRLEDTADILWRRDEKEAAKVAVYHALELASDKPVGEVPFAVLLMERSMSMAIQMAVAKMPPDAQRQYEELGKRRDQEPDSD